MLLGSLCAGARCDIVLAHAPIPASAASLSPETNPLVGHIVNSHAFAFVLWQLRSDQGATMPAVLADRSSEISVSLDAHGALWLLTLRSGTITAAMARHVPKHCRMGQCGSSLAVESCNCTV